ncbi:hypothetical protein J6590_014960 [Homalodisca vitripennis]|nr:hypothetical protein J6590_014960 [Homalodisca vitripennis]
MNVRRTCSQFNEWRVETIISVHGRTCLISYHTLSDPVPTRRSYCQRPGNRYSSMFSQLSHMFQYVNAAPRPASSNAAPTLPLVHATLLSHCAKHASLVTLRYAGTPAITLLTAHAPRCITPCPSSL